MALTAAQMNNSAYLANMINKLAAQKTNALRGNEMTTQQNMRRLREANALNGINGGFEESNYARLLAGQNAARATIGDTYDPQINEYQGYLDALRAAQSAAAAAAEKYRPANDPNVYTGTAATSNLASSLMARALWNRGYTSQAVDDAVTNRIKGARRL